MRLLYKVRNLKRHCELFRGRCELRLHQLSREDSVLEESEKALLVQAEGLRQLLKTYQPDAIIISPGQLRTMLRKQSVLRRNIQDLQVQVLQLKAQRETLQKQCTELQKQRSHFLRKEEMYERWLYCQKKKKQRCALLQDETEQEENSHGKRYTAL